MWFKRIALAVVAAAFLSACQDVGTKQTIGTLLGAGAGAVDVLTLARVVRPSL